jgi:hypothetical protein
MLPSLRWATRAWLLVVALLLVVHWPPPSAWTAAQGRWDKTTGQGPVIVAQPASARLPPPVAEMRDAIVAAVHSGRIDDLKTAVEWNELKPLIADSPVDGPIAYWKKISGDGEGREILAILGEILDAGHVTIPLGKDIENNKMYIWPAFAEMPLDKLTPEQEVRLYRLLKPAEVTAMREKGMWTWYRLAIDADGTWHSFKKSE